MRILFVCLGNICRSPTAEGVMKKLLQDNHLNEIEVASAGTSGFHNGEAPDLRAQQAAKKRGYDLSDIVSRQVSEEDFYAFDHVLAMDESNLANLKDLAPYNTTAKISLFLNYSDLELKDHNVPDPYWGGEGGFDHVLDLIENACLGFLKQEKK